MQHQSEAVQHCAARMYEAVACATSIQGHAQPENVHHGTVRLIGWAENFLLLVSE
jgi:hypothetical protein